MQDLTDELIKSFVSFWVVIAMFIVFLLPIIMIPYIFVKMGGIAGKVQAGIGKFGKNTLRGKGIAGKAAHGAAKRGWENKSAQWAARAPDGSLRKRAGGYQTQRDFKRNERKKSATRLQEEAIHDRLTTDPEYLRQAAGVGGADAVQRLQYGAEATIERREQEERKMAIDSMRRAGIESDRGALVSRVHTATTAAEAHAATDLLLKTGGTEEFKGLLDDAALMSRDNGTHGEAIVAAGRANYGTVDAKSRDVADFMAHSNAAAIAGGGGADAAIRAETQDGTMKLASGKLIALEPKALERAREEAVKMVAKAADVSTPAAEKAALYAKLNTFMAQAAQAKSDVNFGSGKSATQEHIKDIAAGKF